MKRPVSMVDNFAVVDDDGIMKIRFQLSHQIDETKPVERLETQWLHFREGQAQHLVTRLLEMIDSRTQN